MKALLFDVFGTVVDWRGSIIREGEHVWSPRGLRLDWGRFADAWRAGYQPAMERVRTGARPWVPLDQLHREILDQLLSDFGAAHLGEAERDELSRIWHRLDPWPDALAGLARLKRSYIIAPLSNGNVSLLLNMARRAGLSWDAILSAELARQYKPRPEVYLTAVALLGVRPDEAMMVAAHADDLMAAQVCGLRAAFVRRPLEFGPGRAPDEPGAGCDLVADDFIDLDAKLAQRGTHAD